MGYTLSRRRLLLTAAAAAGLTACQAIKTPAKPSSPASVTLPVESQILPTNASRAFEDAYPHIHLDTSGASANLPYQVDWWGGPIGSRTGVADLTPALKLLNFQSSSVFPGILTAWTSQGRALGVPWSITPWGVRWRKDVFAAAKLQAPSAQWTFADFQQTCAVLQGLVASGRVKGLAAVLGPMSPAPITSTVGSRTFTAIGAIAASNGLIFPTTMYQEGLWEAFVRGFGGTISTNGEFSFGSDANSVSAFATLIALIRAYALPVDEVMAVAKTTSSASWVDEVPPLFAMTFDTVNSVQGTEKYPSPPWAWARMPRFPVEPVIPVVSSALVLAGLPVGHAPPAADAPETLATAELGAWLNSPAATNLTGAAGWTPPAAANPSIQTRFWTSPVAAGAAAVGDWQNFSDVYDGFPAVPQEDAVYDAMSSVLAGTASLQVALTQAQQTMNSQLQQ